jgi:phosphopantothenoylcysteine decarboxylase / phosphopantothenate---cysteine ligase
MLFLIMFLDKKILIGITGSVSAYKMYAFVRQLRQKGADIKIIVTPAATEFISTTLLSTFSEHKVYCEFVEEDMWQNHVHLGRWADLFIIAPASCSTIAKMTQGLSDNFLIATYLSCKAPVLIFPAMDEDMWLHPSTKDNIATLRQRGNTVVDPASGLLASGIVGLGRLPEVDEMIIYIEMNYCRKATLAGKTILVTAGPTEEPIDPVRMITNRSSGKMGYAIAEALFMEGANVHLVSGPVAIQPKYSGINLIKVITANEMFEACMALQNAFDVAVFTAAVADYTVSNTSEQKLKKSGETLQLNLVKTKDILGAFGKIKNSNQKTIGFALETETAEKNALNKLKQKNANLIVLNHLHGSNECFNQDSMRVSLIEEHSVQQFETMSKSKIAATISNHIIKNWL